MLLYLERESSKVRESQRTDRYRSRYVLLLWRGVSKCTVIRRIKTSLNGVSRGQVTWIRWPQLLTWLGLEDSLWLSYMEQWQISPWGQRGSQSGLTGWDKQGGGGGGVTSRHDLKCRRGGGSLWPTYIHVVPGQEFTSSPWDKGTVKTFISRQLWSVIMVMVAV